MKRMKVYAWTLCILSGIGALGCLANLSDGDPGNVIGFAYAIAVSVFAGLHIAGRA